MHHGGSDGLAVAVLVLALSAPACAHVHQQYAAYEGRDADRQGDGGTKMSADGIDFWTTGAPPRRYRVLGILTDTRRDRRIAAESFPSDVAEKVKEVGGDAVLYLTESKDFVGTYSAANATATTYGNSTHASGSGFGVAINNKTKQMVVIKYLE
jgi:hypothetical protein